MHPQLDTGICETQSFFARSKLTVPPVNKTAETMRHPHSTNVYVLFTISSSPSFVFRRFLQSLACAQYAIGQVEQKALSMYADSCD